MSGQRTPPSAVGCDLAVGETVRVHGVHVAHWEWARFVLVARRRRLLPGQVLCQLEPGEGIAASVYDAAGVPPPPNPRHAGAARFTVVADVTPVERGHFGHLGTLSWRLRVDRWVTVTPVPPRPARGFLARLAGRKARPA